jgi:uncharacterized protein YdhG (YjbR/CyaY superfamily)
MKKAKRGTRSSAKQARRAPKNVDEYFAGIPEPGLTRLKELRAAIRAAVPVDATETISYGIPAFRGKRVLVWFAAFSNHCSLFPGSGVLEDFKDELKGFTTSKGTIQFPLDRPIPAALVKRLVKARIGQSGK